MSEKKIRPEDYMEAYDTFNKPFPMRYATNCMRRLCADDGTISCSSPLGFGQVYARFEDQNKVITYTNAMLCIFAGDVMAAVYNRPPEEINDAIMNGKTFQMIVCYFPSNFDWITDTEGAPPQNGETLHPRPTTADFEDLLSPDVEVRKSLYRRYTEDA